ncbi:MAG: chorismate synthase [Bacteroidota bacterium]|nr:chorismate synthase [Bacteroidota bacterium]
MIRFLTAGESHGKALSTIVDGFPSNIRILKSDIDFQLKRRQVGYGRGERMSIESDTAEILSGIRHGKSLGSPISLLISNKDWENWEDIMSSEELTSEISKVTIPRPGHADLTGVSKYNFNDIRNSIERSSARETAARVAACSIARIFLKEFDITIGSFVESVGGVFSDNNIYHLLLSNNYHDNKSIIALSTSADKSDLRVLDSVHEKKIKNRIDEVKEKGDTLGGTMVVFAVGLPVGLGSFMQYDRRLDAEITSSIMSVNAVKGIEIGSGFNSAVNTGSSNNDVIELAGGNIGHRTNYSGGIEGGISNGMPLIIRAAMKPISTLANPVETIDLSKMLPVKSRWERSDFTAVPSCSVIAESMLCWSIAKLFIEKFGGDSIEETKDNYNSYMLKLNNRIKDNFK